MIAWNYPSGAAGVQTSRPDFPTAPFMCTRDGMGAGEMGRLDRAAIQERLDGPSRISLISLSPFFGDGSSPLRTDHRRFDTPGVRKTLSPYLARSIQSA